MRGARGRPLRGRLRRPGSPAPGRRSSTMRGMAGHGHRAAVGTPLRVRRLLAAALVPFVLATVVGLVVLWPAHQRHRAARTLGAPAELVNGTVASVDTHACPAGGGRCSTVYVRVTGGPDRGHST